MSSIYQPAGRAAEYCKNAFTVYLGCPYRCKYCYVPNITKQTRKDFHTDKPAPRWKAISDLKRDGYDYKGKPVLLSFLSDPYPDIEIQNEATKRVLDIFAYLEIIPVILTKSNLVERDLDIIRKAGGHIGVTLTFWDDLNAEAWEPGASTPAERIGVLRNAKSLGIKTWVSLEPVIDPEQTLHLIDMIYPIVDTFKIGKLNYFPDLEKEINWMEFLRGVLERMSKYKKAYYIKKDLQYFGRYLYDNI